MPRDRNILWTAGYGGLGLTLRNRGAAAGSTGWVRRACMARRDGGGHGRRVSAALNGGFASDPP
jgi:hypothetical protein